MISFLRILKTLETLATLSYFEYLETQNKRRDPTPNPFDPKDLLLFLTVEALWVLEFTTLGTTNILSGLLNEEHIHRSRHSLSRAGTLLILVQLSSLSFPFDHSHQLLTFWEMSKSVSFHCKHVRDSKNPVHCPSRDIGECWWESSCMLSGGVEVGNCRHLGYYITHSLFYGPDWCQMQVAWASWSARLRRVSSGIPINRGPPCK